MHFSTRRDDRDAIDILVASASTGHGHIAAAEHIARAVHEVEASVVVQTVNVLEQSGDITCAAYENLWRCASIQLPSVYNGLYRRCLRHRQVCRIAKTLVRQRWAAYYRELRNRGVAICIATHPAAACFGAGLKRTMGAQLWVAATDYVLHEGHCLGDADRIYAPPDYALLSIDASQDVVKRVAEVGVPISADFTADVGKCGARERLGLDHDRFTVLVSFGGSALGGLQNLWVLRTLARLPLQTLIITADDDEYYHAARTDPALCFSTPPRVFRFVTNMAELLAACDVIVGKPGGLTTTEAAVAGRPFGIVFNLPGQETFNCEAVIRQERGALVRGPQELYSWISSLLTSRQALEQWSARIRGTGRSSTGRIASDAVEALRKVRVAAA